ncbi:MAG: hypothetical protein E5W06_30250, partial [Mesorhizobium sp.]
MKAQHVAQKWPPCWGATTCVTLTVSRPQRRSSQAPIAWFRLHESEGETDMTTIEFASETPRITTRPAVATRVLNA